MRATVVSLAVGLMAAAAVAHHSTAPFDMTRETAVTGVVTKFLWVNPHATVYLDISEGERWTIEIESPNRLRHQGWTKDTLKSGDRITCKGARAKAASNFSMKCFLVELPDGRTLQAQ